MLLCFSGQIKIIKPPVLAGGPLCKGVQRNWFTLCKFAVPCDSEVPFAIAPRIQMRREAQGRPVHLLQR